MKKILPLIAASLLVAVPAMAQAETPAPVQTTVVAVEGKMLVDANGARLAPVNRVLADGSAQILFNGRVVVVPASTLTVVNGKLTTSMTKVAIATQR